MTAAHIVISQRMPCFVTGARCQHEHCNANSTPQHQGGAVDITIRATPRESSKGDRGAVTLITTLLSFKPSHPSCGVSLP